MNLAQTKQLIESDVVKDFIDVCPHCGTKAHLKMAFVDSYFENHKDLIYYVVFRCVPCKSLSLETFRFVQNQYDANDYRSAGWQDKFPTEDIIFVERFNDIVPDDVLADFKEGVINLQNKCTKSAVSMFRRSLQSSLLNLGANSKEDLIDQIKNLSILTPEIKDWAHSIRIFGNWGVHPQYDNLKDIDQKKAEEARSFLEEFFNYVYVMPNRVAKAKGTNIEKKIPEAKKIQTAPVSK